MGNLFDSLLEFWKTTGFMHMNGGSFLMIVVGIIFISLAIVKNYEPLLLLPIGAGMVAGNIPYPAELGELIGIGVQHEGSVFWYIYQGVGRGIFPPIIFLGIGAMTDFSAMLANPKLILLGAAAQSGIFLTFVGALALGFTPGQAGAIGIIGGADGPTSIFLASQLAPNLLGSIAIAAYSYMSLVPIIQPPIMRLLTTKEEREIRMAPPKQATKRERIFFPIVGLLATTLFVPAALPLLGMLFFGNLLKESTVTERLAETARTSLIDIVTIFLGFSVGLSTLSDRFLTAQSLGIFALGALAFAVATAVGVLFAKCMNLFTKNKINPLVGAAGVSAVPNSARVVQQVGQQEDSSNYLLMHAMAPNVAGVIGSAIAAGYLLSELLQ
ncbi:sodium ion-translocating decarboxylase subunit beta [Chitinivibrio alkaliphilus]|uniref:Oxaloacetate decarboxylase, beta subunit n=1 Tax=Chitinivibrio alkaliphilus ACht1 TaxID=1313304 RepID=U7D974_9BACT|nr:sodium ion-translocating decarboxylase subunit beta [Chitinivibrio alkaliphilus]ERP30950.1 oxaloacetate decarboxylase, beta subunit [Chitinivibrio alkaliphilus ACht1]